MAELKRQQGEFEVAEGLMLEALKLAETKHGKLHPTSVNMAGNLLGISLHEHLTADLEEMVLGNLVAKERLYGVTHPSTIKTMSDLAYAYGEHGRFEDARRLYKRIEDAGGLEALEQLNPSRYATFCGKLADLYFREEQFETAQGLEERALSVRKQIYGDSHRATLVSMANLASTLHAQKKYAEAGVYLRYIVTVREDIVKADPHSIFLLLKSESSLAANLFFQDQFEEAAELYRDILEISQTIGVDAAIMDVWRSDFGKVLEKLPQQELSGR
jgi:pentatricopeptide repeat protein